jgi:hypothetical protein
MGAVKDLARDGASAPPLAGIIERVAKRYMLSVHEMIRSGTSPHAMAARKSLVNELLGRGWTGSQIAMHVGVDMRPIYRARQAEKKASPGPTVLRVASTPMEIREAQRAANGGALRLAWPLPEAKSAPQPIDVTPPEPAPPESERRPTPVHAASSERRARNGVGHRFTAEEARQAALKGAAKRAVAKTIIVDSAVASYGLARSLLRQEAKEAAKAWARTYVDHRECPELMGIFDEVDALDRYAPGGRRERAAE